MNLYQAKLKTICISFKCSTGKSRENSSTKSKLQAYKFIQCAKYKN